MTEAELLYNRRAEPLRVRDGDTFECRIDLGWGFKIEPTKMTAVGVIRLYGIQAAEMTRKAGTSDAAWKVQKAEADAARVELARLLGFPGVLPEGHVYLLSRGIDKYGRALGVVWLDIAEFGDDSKSINADLIRRSVVKRAPASWGEPLQV